MGQRESRMQEDKFTTEKSPLEGMMIESFEKAPENEYAIVSTLVASFRDAKKRQREISGPNPQEVDWEKYLESQWSRYYQPDQR